MPRTARLTVVGLPHHVTQRGNRRQPIFLKPGDQKLYLHMLTEQCAKDRVEVWAYCLMPNHVHLVMTPQSDEGLTKAVAETHRQYANAINRREGWTGHLFQDRFASSVMDERHLLAAFRYVALNPVRSGLVERAQDWPWSSIHAHLSGRDGRLVRVAPLLNRVGQLEELIAPDEVSDRRWSKEIAALRVGAKSSAPVGEQAFIHSVLGRSDRSGSKHRR